MMIRTIVVDDEPLGRSGVSGLLAQESDFQVVAECGNGHDALAAIEELHPDLVFLDVQMPGMDGFDVIQAANPTQAPAVVFVTAYDEFALQAFEANAIDYLLKPIDPDRFSQALDRVRGTLRRPAQQPTVDTKWTRLLDEIRGMPRGLTQLVVRSGARMRIIRMAEVDWIAAEGNYLRLHIGSTSHLYRSTITSIEQQLDPDQFVRIHRSTIVRIDRIREVESLFQGEYMVILTDGTRVNSSRSYRENLEGALGITR